MSYQHYITSMIITIIMTCTYIHLYGLLVFKLNLASHIVLYADLVFEFMINRIVLPIEISHLSI